MPSLLQKSWILKAICALLIFVVVIFLALVLLDEYFPGENYRSLGERAFGNLSAPGAQNASRSSLSAVGMGGGTEVEKDEVASTYPIIDNFIPSPEEIVAYEYIYSGELPDLSTIDARVFRKVVTPMLSSSLNEAASNLDLGVLPLSVFKNLSISYLTMSEDEPNGFVVNVDSINGTLSLNRNNAYWQNIDYSRVLTESDLPTDETLLKMSNDFLAKYKIDHSQYGDPVFDRSWVNLSVWVPDSLQVLYPLLIDGREVFSMWGPPSGMQVTVNIRTNQIDGIFSSLPSTFETSDYKIVTDAQKILDTALRGGMWEYQAEDATKVYSSTLGEPSLVLAEHYIYDDAGTGTTLFVPALRFPVVSNDKDSPYKRDWVVVPLVEEILESFQTATSEPEALLEK